MHEAFFALKRPLAVTLAAAHKQPADTPHVETTLAPGELISGFTVNGRWPHSVYLKARDRQSYEFALASAAVALDIRDGLVQDARVALGGVATVPWRAHEAEAQLKSSPFDGDLAGRAAEAAFMGAAVRKHNAYRVALGRRVMVRALHKAAMMEI